jgi:hypothetical protein
VGRHGIDPAARSLLILIARDPEETLATLAAARSLIVERVGDITLASAIRRNAAGYTLQQGTRAFTPA